MCLIPVIQIPAFKSFIFIFIHHNRQIIPVKLRKCLQCCKSLCHGTKRNNKHTNFIFWFELTSCIYIYCNLPQYWFLIYPLIHIILIIFKQIFIWISIPWEQSQSIILPLLDISVRYNLSKLFCHFIYTICTTICLHKWMPDKILIQIQCI